MMKTMLKLSLMPLLIAALCGPLLAGTEPSPFITYQGVLRGADDSPLTGDYDMQFLFYDAETGGDLLLTDTHAGTEAVQLQYSLFVVAVGAGSITSGLAVDLPDTFANHGTVWMEVRVWNGATGGWEILTPRTRVLSAPSALNSSRLAGEESTFYLDTSEATQTKDGDLAIGGQLTITGGGPADGKVLTSNATGLASWGDGLPGPEGPQGPIGPAGPQGPVGPAGGIAPPSHSISTIVSINDVGYHASVTLFTNGNPIIAYVDDTSHTLKVARCNNGPCTSARDEDTGYAAGTAQHEQISIVIGADGFPLIAHGDDRLVDCADVGCSISSSRSLPSDGYISIVVGPEGNPLLSYRDGGALRLVYCLDTACSVLSGEVTIDDAPGGFSYNSLILGQDGLPMIAYASATEEQYLFARCQDYDCTTIQHSTIYLNTGSSLPAGEISLTVGNDGLPAMSFYDVTDGDLEFVRCNDRNCTTNPSRQTLDSTGDVGAYSSITIGNDGFPVIAYYHHNGPDNHELMIIKCGSEDCSINFGALVLDDPLGNHDVGRFCSILMEPDGAPVIVYYDETERDLKVLKCGNGACLPYWTRK